MNAVLIFGMSSHWSAIEGLVGLTCLAPLLLFGFAGEWSASRLKALPRHLRMVLPLVLAIPYLAIALADHVFRWQWLAVYCVVPLTVVVLLWFARSIDPQQRGVWPDYIVLKLLGLAVDLRWFEPAWPAHLHAIGKIVLLDAGLYGFLVIRQLDGCGIDFRARWSDWKIGLRELLFYAPIAIPLGLVLGFLHLHRVSAPWYFPLAWLYTIVFIALPEEIFFRGWMQNLIERRTGRRAALIITSIVFGLSHFNKKSTHFNWEYVLLAAIAGIFYGRAWRSERRVAASAITHATVDTLWGIWLL